MPRLVNAFERAALERVADFACLKVHTYVAGGFFKTINLT